MTLVSCKARTRLATLLVIVSFAFVGCATKRDQQTEKAPIETLLDRQFAAIQTESSQNENRAPRIWYAGFGLHSSSNAFKLDVASGARWIAQLDAKAALLTLANPSTSQAADWPYATQENIRLTIAQMGAKMKKDDIAVVLFTSHGNTNVLDINVSGREYPFLRGQALAQLLEPLVNHRTVLIVSACFSGSLIPSLVSPSRIVLTAAAPDRSSFGCQPKSTNTYFVEELIRAASDSSKNLNQVFAAADLAVDRKERAMRLKPASLPQMRVPPRMQGFAQTPIKDWLN